MDKLTIGAVAILAGLILVSALPLSIDSPEIYGDLMEERSGQFEGDIILNERQKRVIESGNTRNGLVDLSKRWPNKVVPVRLSPNHTKEQNDYIDKALRTLESISCVKFVWHTNQVDFVGMQAGDGGCYSMVGYQGREQVLNLKSFAPGTGCFRLGTIMHEFLHALGFFHMQSGVDRDEHVKIEWNHIINGTQGNFNKYNSSVVTDFGIPYDYTSVMHYSAYAFTKDGYATIVPNNITYIKSIGQRQVLSREDILKLNEMYNCTAA